MVHRFWEGTVNGGYVGHGDTFLDPNDVLWWAKGGTIKGESAPRLAFLRRILEEGPVVGLEPIPSTIPYIFARAGGVDKVNFQDLFNPTNQSPDPGAVPEGSEQVKATSQEGQQPSIVSGFAGVHQPHEYYLTYFGVNQPSEIEKNVPAREEYKAEIVDTWKMTVTPVDGKVLRGDTIRLPVKPNQALILKRVH